MKTWSVMDNRNQVPKEGSCSTCLQYTKRSFKFPPRIVLRKGGHPARRGIKIPWNLSLQIDSGNFKGDVYTSPGASFQMSHARWLRATETYCLIIQMPRTPVMKSAGSQSLWNVWRTLSCPFPASGVCGGPLAFLGSILKSLPWLSHGLLPYVFTWPSSHKDTSPIGWGPTLLSIMSS